MSKYLGHLFKCGAILGAAIDKTQTDPKTRDADGLQLVDSKGVSHDELTYSDDRPKKPPADFGPAAKPGRGGRSLKVKRR